MKSLARLLIHFKDTEKAGQVEGKQNDGLWHTQ